MDEQLIALNNKLTTIYTQLQEYNIKQSQYFSEIIDIINKEIGRASCRERVYVLV